MPAMLRDLIPRLGNYGAIQSVAATLAEAHGLDTAACVWVVREFARALGLIASGGTQPTAALARRRNRSGSAAARPMPGRAPRPPAAAAAVGGGGAGAGAGPAPGCRAGLGWPPGMPRGRERPPRRPSSGSRVLSRNTIGIAAAIALVAGYLGVAAVAHLSPFPAKTVAAASSAPASQGNGTQSQPGWVTGSGSRPEPYVGLPDLAEQDSERCPGRE